MTAPDARLTRDDAMTLIGHAEYLRKVHGEEDMPRFFSGLANRILALLSAPQEREAGNIHPKRVQRVLGRAAAMLREPVNHAPTRLGVAEEVENLARELAAEPAPAALAPAVREAAERLRHALTPPRSITPDGYIFFRAEDVETILSALDSANGGAR